MEASEKPFNYFSKLLSFKIKSQHSLSNTGAAPHLRTLPGIRCKATKHDFLEDKTVQLHLNSLILPQLSSLETLPIIEAWTRGFNRSYFLQIFLYETKFLCEDKSNMS